MDDGARLLRVQCKTGVEASLRVDPPRNGQSKLVRFAADYEIAKIDVTLGLDRHRVA